MVEMRIEEGSLNPGRQPIILPEKENVAGVYLLEKLALVDRVELVERLLT